jgi:hypothetical protein
VNKYALTNFSTNYSDASQECAQAHTNTLMPMKNKIMHHDYNFNMLSALKRKYKVFNVHISMGGLLSTLLFSWEGFCSPCHFHGRAFPPCHFHRRAFVHLVIFKGGLLSALSLFDRRAFVWEGF